jgi:8-oxo-dGTP diphosphatase
MLSFGTPDPTLDYLRRPAVFGLVIEKGLLACVQVDRGEGTYLDLPGGAIDGDETEVQALVREFVEETGMTVQPVARIAEASQTFLKTDGSPVRNVGGFWTCRCLSIDPAAKVEDDHALVWLDPAQALARLRHDAHAWAVSAWLRR